MNEKPTVPNRKIYDLRMSTPQSLQQKGEEVEEEQLCMEHSCPIEYLCFTCCESVLCAQCISSTKHLGHDLKNIERSKQFLKSQLQEWNIRLQSKSELLDVFHDQLRNNRADIFKYAELYKEKLASEFEELSKKLEEKLTEIYARIAQFTNDYKNDCIQKAQKIRLRRLQLSKMLQINRSKLDNTSVQHQAQYFSQKKQYVDSLLEEGEILYYKQQFVEPNWGIDPQIFKNIYTLVDKLTMNFKFPQPYRDIKDLKEKVRESLKKSVKKSKKDLKLPDTEKITEKIERHSSKARNSNIYNVSPFFSTLTPKNTSIEKKLKGKKGPGDTLLKKRKKSSTKILSMPASPEKEHQQQMQGSPHKSRKNLFKKK